MGYLIGAGPLDPAVKRYDGGTSSFTMDNSGTTNGTLLWVDGVAQVPGTDYNVSGTTITTTTAAGAGTNNVTSLQLFNTGLITTPADNTVAIAKIQDDAVTLAKMAAGTDGNIISYDASGNPVAIATGNDGQVLTSAGAGAQPAFEAASAGAMTFISNTDISDAATYDFTAFTAGSYEHYVFYLQNLIPVTDAVFLWVRTSTDGGSSFDAGAADYDWCGAGATSYTTTQFVSRDHSDAQIALTGKLAGQPSVVVGSDTNENGASGFIHLFGPHTTSYTHVWTSLMVDNAYGESAGHFFVGKRLEAADVDGFQILFSSGNIESGTITAYGLANA